MQNTELAMRSEILREIRLRVSECNAMLLENAVHLEPRFEAKHAPDLVLRQRASAVALDRKRFERPLGHIRPSRL